MLLGEEYLISHMMFQGAPFPTNLLKMHFWVSQQCHISSVHLGGSQSLVSPGWLWHTGLAVQHSGAQGSLSEDARSEDVLAPSLVRQK